MESFEHFVKIWLETKNYTVSSGRKFPVKMKTRRQSRDEYQTHGYEVDLVASRSDELLLVSVKSFFGSHGLSLAKVKSEKLIGNRRIRMAVQRLAAKLYGYKYKQVHLWLCVGNLKSKERVPISEFVSSITCGGRPIRLVKLEEMVGAVIDEAKRTTYFDDPAITAMKALIADGRSLNRAGQD